MSNNKKIKSSHSIKSDQEPDIWDWLTKGTGTASEHRPTAKELLADSQVQEQIQNVQEAFKSSKNKLKGS